MRVDSAIAHVHLTIELDSDPIRGAVALAGGGAREFSGWIELAEAIEEARIGLSVVSLPDQRDGAL